MLTIDVQKVDFDPDVLQLRISGTVQSENELVRLGAHHTLTLELHQNFTIVKECWDQIFLDRLEEAIHPERQAEIAAVVMQTGLAHVCLVTGALTITKACIDTNIPKKRVGSSQHAKSIVKFYEAVYQAVIRHIDFAKVKAVLVGSPGFVNQDFFQYMQKESVRRDDRAFIENKSKFVLCKASSGHKHALEEMFSDPGELAQTMLRMNSSRSCIALTHHLLSSLSRNHGPNDGYKSGQRSRNIEQVYAHDEEGSRSGVLRLRPRCQGARAARH